MKMIQKRFVPSGATGEHYLQFINDTIDIMDKFLEMKGVLYCYG